MIIWKSNYAKFNYHARAFCDITMHTQRTVGKRLPQHGLLIEERGAELYML